LPQHPIAQPLGCRVDDRLAGPLDEVVRDKRIGLDGDVDPHRGRCPGVIGPKPVLNVLRVLLFRALCVPHQPVRAPTKFENFLVESPKYPYREAYVVRTAVVVPVEDLGPPVWRRIGQECLDVGERIHDGFRRRLDHDFA
jgi:hypothetical protein